MQTINYDDSEWYELDKSVRVIVIEIPRQLPMQIYDIGRARFIELAEQETERWESHSDLPVFERAEAVHGDDLHRLHLFDSARELVEFRNRVVKRITSGAHVHNVSIAAIDLHLKTFRIESESEH